MARPQLTAEPRSVLGKQVSQLRREGRLPGVVYGAGRDSQAISVDLHEFELLHRHAGRHAVLDLNVAGGGRSQPVLLQAIQEHPVNRRPIHVDLLAVNLDEERTVDVPIIIVGESVAVDKMGGVLLHFHDTVLVRAKPDDLPSGVELDISSLDSFEAVLHVSDLKIPAGVTLMSDPAEALARVQQPRTEEAAVAAEGETPAEGEAAEEGAESSESAADGASE
jgi:large subunit ribosomal protein L25